MKLESWMRYLVAAALIILVGAAWVLAEEKKISVEVQTDDGQEMTINVNGVTEVIQVEDLADGEERTYDVGGHEMTVKRVGDNLTLVHDKLMMSHHGDHHQEFWVEGNEVSPGERRVVIMKHGDGGEFEFDVDAHGDHDVFILKGEDGEIDIEALKEKYGDDFEEFHTAHGAHVMKWVDEGDGEHPIVIRRMGHHAGGDYVTYRCEETGSMLTVKADGNLLDDYLDPVTGCVMKKVEQAGAHVIKIQKRKVCEGEDE